MPADVLTPEAAIVMAVFFLAGTVKGIVGLGLPTVALGLLTAWSGLEGAMALLLVPSFATNVWQAVQGPGTLSLVRRLLPMLAAAVLATWLGMLLFVRTDAAALAILLGALIALYGAIGLAGVRPPAISRHERWLGPLAGAVNGFLTGLTGSFVVPGVFYLQALALPRDHLVKAMGILFTVSTLALGAALFGAGRLQADLGLLSAFACIPAFVGMAVGAAVRRRLSEAAFRQFFFAALLALGAAVIVRAGA